MLAELVEIRILGQPLEIAVAEDQSLFEGFHRLINFAVKGVTAGEVIKDHWIARLQPGQLPVHPQAMIMFTALGVIVSQHLQRLDALRVAADKPLQEGDFDIQLPGFFPGQRLDTGT